MIFFSGFDGSHNRFEGPIASSWFSHAYLVYLYLDDNLLGGALPSSLPPNLQILSLNGNEYEGEIPSSYGSHDNLRELYLNDNKLNGTLPDELPPKVTKLDLGKNKFTGEKEQFFHKNKQTI